MTRQEIVIKVADKTALSTVSAMRWLKRQLGKDFKLLFQTLTSDNGCEFADQAGLDALGLTTYYCHPQAPHERGGNENNNKLLRRYFPKGKSMRNKTQYDATMAQHFINGYPREMFGGDAAATFSKRNWSDFPIKIDRKSIAFLVFKKRKILTWQRMRKLSIFSTYSTKQHFPPCSIYKLLRNYLTAAGRSLCLSENPHRSGCATSHMSIKQQPRPLELHRPKGLTLYPMGFYLSDICADLPHQ